MISQPQNKSPYGVFPFPVHHNRYASTFTKLILNSLAKFKHLSFAKTKLQVVQNTNEKRGSGAKVAS